MRSKNKRIRYYNLIKKIANWKEYLFFKAFGKKDAFNFQLRNSFQLNVPGQLLSAFRECFLDEIYIRRLPDTVLKNLENKKKEVVVVDIGANAGFFSLFMFSLFPKARVYAFEPMPYNYNILHTYSKKYPHFKWHAVNKAVSNTNAEITLHASKIDGYTTLASVFHSARNDKEITVEATTLEKVVEEYKLDNIDFLKLDCEGAEYAILYSLPKAILEKVAVITIETHTGAKPKENIFSMVNYLKENKYELEYLDEGKSGYIWAWRNNIS